MVYWFQNMLSLTIFPWGLTMVIHLFSVLTVLNITWWPGYMNINERNDITALGSLATCKLWPVIPPGHSRLALILDSFTVSEHGLIRSTANICLHFGLCKLVSFGKRWKFTLLMWVQHAMQLRHTRTFIYQRWTGDATQPCPIPLAVL